MVILKLSNVEKAYLAGIVDGEGSLYIARQEAHGNNGQLKYFYRARVTVANTDIGVLTWLTNTIKVGAFCYPMDSRKEKKGWKDVWQWTLASKAVEEFLEQLLPYLVIKKERATLLIRYRKLINTRTHVYAGHPLTKKEVDTREQIYKEVKELNKKGECNNIAPEV